MKHVEKKKRQAGRPRREVCHRGIAGDATWRVKRERGKERKRERAREGKRKREKSARTWSFCRKRLRSWSM